MVNIFSCALSTRAWLRMQHDVVTLQLEFVTFG